MYIFVDPFKVIYDYDNYYDTETVIHKNRDFVSSEMYFKNSGKYEYDSFIFGSSTALFFQPHIWEEYINTRNHVFSFDSSRENIVGIWSKIKYIHEHGGHIKNALLIIDTGITFGQFNNKGHIFMKHYRIYKSSGFKFHYQSLLSFLNFRFIIALVHYKISKQFHPYMKGTLEDRSFSFDLITNELDFDGPRLELINDSIGYYERRHNLFFQRDTLQVEVVSQITKDHIRMLVEIRDIFLHNNTDYRIIITPLYNQIAFNKDDLKTLENIFSEDFIFNFSGINEFTNELSNYYDIGHFKEYIGAQMLNMVFEKLEQDEIIDQ